MEHFTVVYLTSRGHSGSTLTELILGAHPEVTCLGELKQLNTDRGRRCRCGAGIPDACPFWRRLDEALENQTGLRLAQLELQSKDPETFARHNLAFFEAAARLSGCSVLVDSSKSVDRLARLLDAQLFPMRVIHLVRSPLGVTHSNVKLGRDWRRSARGYTTGMMNTRRVLRGREHLVLELRYEDLARAMEPSIAGILAGLGLRFHRDQHCWAAQDTHTVAGNAMRFGRDSTIRLDASWRSGLSRGQKLGVSWWTLPARVPGTLLYDLLRPLWKGEGARALAAHAARGARRRLRRRSSAFM